ncbi:uncharacterized protein EV154DRAFT_288656 [Mucor mucedo]|uniref:uncharacterized protein n=1 Tax=Mucor mucedo TaxID=29922 RepID=UPI00221F4A5F|nr:uncharacterized protein EV154DRAFT_288656 [Mucor mucedo]KAI7889234.1 hypothetical protein EV154DRAFT_288656 [Mucor mucedo]
MVLHPMYQPAQVTPPAMDLSPPAEFLQEVYDEPEILDTSTRVVTPKLSEANTLVTSEFIQSSPSPLQPITSNIFPASTNVKDVESKDFPMETNFRKSTSVPTESDFKTKCKRMIRNAKGLVCKPTSPKPTVKKNKKDIYVLLFLLFVINNHYSFYRLLEQQQQQQQQHRQHRQQQHRHQ